MVRTAGMGIAIGDELPRQWVAVDGSVVCVEPRSVHRVATAPRFVIVSEHEFPCSTANAVGTDHNVALEDLSLLGRHPRLARSRVFAVLRYALPK